MPEYPHYTRPPRYRGWEVPEVLLSGDHEKVRQWRLEQSRAAGRAVRTRRGVGTIPQPRGARTGLRRFFLADCRHPMSSVIDSIERAQLRQGLPSFDPGDRVRVHFQVIEGSRRRTQVFEGIVLKRQGSGARETFTVRKQSFGVGVERTFPLHSPKIEKLEIAARGDVRRAKLYYLRGRIGKAARVAERRWGIDEDADLGADRGRGADGGRRRGRQPGARPRSSEAEAPPRRPSEAAPEAERRGGEPEAAARPRRAEASEPEAAAETEAAAEHGRGGARGRGDRGQPQRRRMPRTRSRPEPATPTRTQA